MTVKRFTEFEYDLDSILRKYISQYAMGQEVWFEYWYGASQQPRVTGVAPTGEMIGQMYTLPAYQVAVGMRGLLLGPENYVWEFFIVDAPTDTEKSIQETVEKVMKDLFNQRSRQGSVVNGQAPKEIL